MATHAEIATNLLRSAANFFRDIAGQNADIKEQMEKNAETYDVVASLLEQDPNGVMDLPEEQ